MGGSSQPGGVLLRKYVQAAAFCQTLWYNEAAASPPQWGEVDVMGFALSLMVSLAANVISYFVCKWLDGKR